MISQQLVKEKNSQRQSHKANPPAKTEPWIPRGACGISCFWKAEENAALFDRGRAEPDVAGGDLRAVLPSGWRLSVTLTQLSEALGAAFSGGEKKGRAEARCLCVQGLLGPGPYFGL